jgi:MoaA/NifB/PqqE/SkfB family radical SAM enzyme
MYKFEEIRDIHLEITSKCQAKCPMCPRRINGGMLNPFLELNEIDLDTFKLWFPVGFIKQLDSLFMCGNYGDPIIAKDCLEVFEYLSETNPNIHLSMHTNGSARDIDWWMKLGKTVDRVVFGIDGLQDTHSLYRINTNFDKIIENASAFINAGGIAEWHMLVFKHNEHQIESCRQLSKDLGFDKFLIKHTSRFIDNKFNVLDDAGKTIDILYPTSKSKEISNKLKVTQIETHSEITCKAQKYKQIYIGADGSVTPCCWLDLNYIQHRHDNRIDYMDKIGYFPNLNQNSLSEIFMSDYFDKIEQTWDTNPLKECTKQCGKIDKLKEQFCE